MLFVLLCVVSTVNATDNVTGDVVNVNDETDFVQTNNDNQITSEEPLSTNEGDIISASPGTFTDLANDIENASEELNLTKNYIYNSSSDSSYPIIAINKKITINGNGFIINGNGNLFKLKINQNNVILKNINIINCYNVNGVIEWIGLNGQIINSSFYNCTSYSNSGISGGGGAIYWNGENGSIVGSNFTNCTMNGKSYDKGGGAVFWKGNNGNIRKCNFINNTATIETTSSGSGGGGAIFWYSNNGLIDNSTFINNFAKDRDGDNIYFKNNGNLSNCRFLTGSIYIAGTNADINNCTFTNSSNRANLITTNCTIKNCFFDNYMIRTYGVNCQILNNTFLRLTSDNAISLTCDNYLISECDFINCYGVSWIIYAKSINGSIVNCNFINTSNMLRAEYKTYEEFLKRETYYITNCSFFNSSGLSTCSKTLIEDCEFINSNISGCADNSSINNCNFINSAIYISNNYVSISKCNFTEYSRNTYQNVIYCISNNCSIYDCNFINNTLMGSNRIILFTGDNCSIYNCNFINNSQSSSKIIHWGVVERSLVGILGYCNFENEVNNYYNYVETYNTKIIPKIEIL